MTESPPGEEASAKRLLGASAVASCVLGAGVDSDTPPLPQLLEEGPVGIQGPQQASISCTILQKNMHFELGAREVRSHAVLVNLNSRVKSTRMFAVLLRTVTDRPASLNVPQLQHFADLFDKETTFKRKSSGTGLYIIHAGAHRLFSFCVPREDLEASLQLQ